MSPTKTTTQTAQQRAEAAAEELSASGVVVTNRAVRERAGVSMTIASQVAQEWNARAAEQAPVPEMPDIVQKRLEGVWREIYTAAADTFGAERAGQRETIQGLEEERAALAEDLAAAEARAEQAESSVRETATAAEADRERLAQERSRADRAEGALEAITAERDRLLAQVEALSEQFKTTVKKEEREE